MCHNNHYNIVHKFIIYSFYCLCNVFRNIIISSSNFLLVQDYKDEGMHDCV